MIFDEQDGYALSDLAKRLSNIIRIGTIFEINHQTAKARVKVGELETDFLPWANSNSGSNNSWNPPEIDEQVIILSPSGDLSQAVILPSFYKNNASDSDQNIKSITYQDGSKISFNVSSGTLDLDLKGDVTIKVVGNANIESDNINITASSNITLDGDVDLGGSGGQGVARIGDLVDISAGSSSGQWPIISGSSKVKSA
ncbi:phage baseplate assembly protein V [Rickettsiales bacterium]|nr:phage baseplate assembly protein V [Rickettsiales bacterium]